MNIHLPKIIIFLSCLIFFHLPGKGQNIDFGKSYVNITKGTNGGTVEPGDILEIRASIVVRSGTYDSCGYFDAIPAGTVYMPGTIRVLTNEGKIYKQFTDAQYDDEGWRSGFNIRINLGYVQIDNPARSYRRGRIRNGSVSGQLHKPSFSNTCIQVASFRVRVTAAIGSIISTGGGYMTYKRSGTTTVQTFNFPANYVAIYTNMGMCPNTVGANSIGAEFNGTFGSGKPRNRGASANVPPGYTYSYFTNNNPNDYYYGVANNTSNIANYTTLNTWSKPDNSSPTHRVFSVWDIIGDHTGASNPTLGNPPADTVNNPNAGYMLVVNAAYRIDSAFQQNITGLCPNTFYEISCWIRNICSKCGTDSNGRNATGGAGYIPTAPGDSSGVKPNITFEVDGIDYYSTGNIDYNGEWVKRGFNFRTGPTQTSFTLKFFNNAPGGGGNDWALDDIAVATCYPDLSFTPSNYTGCADNLVTFDATVRSYFDNYTYYKWQVSADGGVSWSDEGISGTGTPALDGQEYIYTVTHPPFVGHMADSGKKYRLMIATTNSNLADPNCSMTSLTDLVTLNLTDCIILPVQVTDWSGEINHHAALLKWSTENETELVMYEIEKSQDGVHFHSIGKVSGVSENGNYANQYTFPDPQYLEGETYYRLKIQFKNGLQKYSPIIILSDQEQVFHVKPTGNPFHVLLGLKLTLPSKGVVNVQLLDLQGRVVFESNKEFEKGLRDLSEPVPGTLKPGIYILKVMFKNEQMNFRMLKE